MKQIDTLISTRRGIVDTRGTLLGPPDKGSQTRKCPQGTFEGHPVVGWSKAQKMGLLEIIYQGEGRTAKAVFAHRGEEHQSVRALLDDVARHLWTEEPTLADAKLRQLRAALGY